MYIFFRLLIGLALLCIGMLWLRRTGRNNKRFRAFLFLFAAISVVTLYLLPVENAFVKFDSPEESYHYTNSGIVEMVIKGKTTCFVVASNNKTESYLIIPGAEHAWKIGRGVDTKPTIHQLSDTASIQVFQYKEADEYYIVISGIQEGELSIADNRGTVFSSKSFFVRSLESEYYTYFAYVADLDGTYKLFINDEEISFLTQEKQ